MTTKAYNESVGTSPSSALIALDHVNWLVAVSNENAIHLLDRTVTFKKLLMTEVYVIWHISWMHCTKELVNVFSHYNQHNVYKTTLHTYRVYINRKLSIKKDKKLKNKRKKESKAEFSPFSHMIYKFFCLYFT